MEMGQKAERQGRWNTECVASERRVVAEFRVVYMQTRCLMYTRFSGAEHERTTHRRAAILCLNTEDWSRFIWIGMAQRSEG